MKFLAIAAVGLLTLGLGGCMHMGQGMHSMHEGGMMEGHQQRACPTEQADHQSSDPAAAHEHADGAPQDDCPDSAHPN